MKQMHWRDKLLVTRAEASEILSMSIKAIDRLCAAGKLRRSIEGRQVRILTSSLIDYADGVEPAVSAPVLPPLSREVQEAVNRALHRARTGEKLPRRGRKPWTKRSLRKLPRQANRLKLDSGTLLALGM